MGTEFAKSIVRECSFADADLTSASFKECDLTRTVFNSTILDKADFSRASNYQIDIRSNRLNKAKFTLPEAIALLEMLDIEIE